EVTQQAPPTQEDHVKFMLALDSRMPNDIPRSAELGEMMMQQGMTVCAFAIEQNITVEQAADEFFSGPATETQEDLMFAGLFDIVVEEAGNHLCPAHAS